MLVSSLTALYTPRQTLSVSTLSKDQPLFKSLTGLNRVFQPPFTVTPPLIVTPQLTVFSCNVAPANTFGCR